MDAAPGRETSEPTRSYHSALRRCGLAVLLWTAFWLASIAILLRAGMRKSGAAWAGLMLGLAAAVSAKTALLAICLGIAAVTMHLLTRDRWRVAARNVDRRQPQHPVH